MVKFLKFYSLASFRKVVELLKIIMNIPNLANFFDR